MAQGLGCWCSCSPRAGLGPGTGLGSCLWLSFTQIADPACGNQKFGAQGTQGESLVGQRSYLAFFAGEAASGWGLQACVGCRASTLGCLGARTWVTVSIAYVDLPSFDQNCKTIHMVTSTLTGTLSFVAFIASFNF